MTGRESQQNLQKRGSLKMGPLEFAERWKSVGRAAGVVGALAYSTWGALTHLDGGLAGYSSVVAGALALLFGSGVFALFRLLRSGEVRRWRDGSSPQ